MTNLAITLAPSEKETVATIWHAPNYNNDYERLGEIDRRIGRLLTRGWCRLHFGPPGPTDRQPRTARQRTPDEIRRLNADRWPYQRYATGAVMRVGMNYLSDLIIRPGIEKKFGPLLLYRGPMNYGHAHRLWNFALLMMASECETLADGYRVLNNPAFSQLCGPMAAPWRPAMQSYFGRLWDNPAVTNNIEGFTEYVKSLELGPCRLIRVDRFSDKINCAPWRISLHENAGQDYRDRERGIPKSQELFYPYLAHDAEHPDGARDLVMLVNQSVPDYFPDHIRADICQDLIVGLLSGDIGVGQIHDRVEECTRNTWKLHGKYADNQYGLSLDEPIPGTAGSDGGINWRERV